MNATQNRALELLFQHLNGLQTRGITRFYLDPESKKMLAALPKLISQNQKPASSFADAFAHAHTPRKHTTPQQTPRATQPDELPLLREIAARQITPEGATKFEKLANIERLILSCTGTRNLGSLRDRLIFSDGSPDARLMIVGDVPSEADELHSKPFVGAAGEMMIKILHVMGLKREEVYLTNILKYRTLPTNENSPSTTTRPPTAEELAISLPYLRAEINTVNPEIIIALGGAAATGLLNGSKISVVASRGRPHHFEGRPLIITFHPDHLLRADSQGLEASKREKRKVWEDMLLVMTLLKMPINDKQNRFFL